MGADEIIHQSTRPQDHGRLNTLERREALEFTRLKAMVNVTDGNLGAHIDTLAGLAMSTSKSCSSGAGRRRASRRRRPDGARSAVTLPFCASFSIRPRTAPRGK